MKDSLPPSTRTRYSLGSTIRQMCEVLQLDHDRVLLRAGQEDLADPDNGAGQTIEQCYALWSAIESEVNRPEFILDLARFSAQVGFIPAVFAFACSPTVEIGLQRLSTFKPLVGPIVLSTTQSHTGLMLEITSPDPAHPFPPSLAAFELVCLLEMMRTHSGAPIAPLRIEVPADTASLPLLRNHLNQPIHHGPHLRILLSPKDAKRALVSKDPTLWAVFEPELRRQLSDFETVQTMPARVRRILVGLLPGGQSASQVVADRLGISKRSLNRRLSAENTTFQQVLTATRLDLAEHYLSQPQVSTDEVSFLLGYSDPNSFYRAFRTWTGETPQQCRDRLADQS